MEKAWDPGSHLEAIEAREHLTAANEHLTAAREYLKATRRSLAAVRCSLAAVRCSVAAVRLAGFFHLWLSLWRKIQKIQLVPDFIIHKVGWHNAWRIFWGGAKLFNATFHSKKSTIIYPTSEIWKPYTE